MSKSDREIKLWGHLILLKMGANTKQNIIKLDLPIHEKIIHHNKIGFISEMKDHLNVQKSINVNL